MNKQPNIGKAKGSLKLAGIFFIACIACFIAALMPSMNGHHIVGGPGLPNITEVSIFFAVIGVIFFLAFLVIFIIAIAQTPINDNDS